MCRLFGLVSNKSVSIVFSMLKAPNSLKRQSAEHEHNDGWGIGYYENSTAIVHKEPQDAQYSARFSELARAIHSMMFIAHVRKSTTGQINHANTHPFLMGNWLLAQNGGIGATWHHKIREKVGRGRIKGSTSGEHLLAWLYQNAGDLSGKKQEDAIKRVLQELVRSPEEITSANFILTTGEKLYAFRYARSLISYYSLFLLQRLKKPAPLHSKSTGMGITIENKGIPAQHREVCLIASEKLTDEPWELIQNGMLVVINADLSVQKVKVL